MSFLSVHVFFLRCELLVLCDVRENVSLIIPSWPCAFLFVQGTQLFLSSMYLSESLSKTHTHTDFRLDLFVIFTWTQWYSCHSRQTEVHERFIDICYFWILQRIFFSSSSFFSYTEINYSNVDLAGSSIRSWSNFGAC